MTEKTKEQKIKTLIIVLAILLCISIVSLAATLIYNHFVKSPPSSVTIPDNIITPDEDDQTDKTPSPGDSTEPPAAPEPVDPDPTDDTPGTGETEAPSGTPGTTDDTSGTDTPSTDSPSETPAASARPVAVIDLHDKNPGDNLPFNVSNMFPGDREIRYYCVRVSYHDDVTVHFRADIRNGYEKLAEVMKMKVTLPGSGEVMYDGLMKDIPESLSKKLSSPDSTTDELYYKITAYLDTSVGNEYMDKELVADFKWWVEETGRLDPPKTGSPVITIWMILAGASLLMIIILSVYKKKYEEEQNER